MEYWPSPNKEKPMSNSVDKMKNCGISKIHFPSMASALSQLILKKGFVTLKGQKKNMLHQSIEIGAGVRIRDLGQLNVLVPLTKPRSDA